MTGQEILHWDGQALTARLNGETLTARAAGPDSIRISATRNARFDRDLPSALLPGLAPPEATAQVTTDHARLTVGRLALDLTIERRVLGPAVTVAFARADTGAPLLAEEAPHFMWPEARHYTGEAGDLWRIETRFAAHEGERFWGLGQHQHGRLDQKGCVIELLQANTEVVIPFAISSRGYGFLWNNPGTGRVEMAANATRWVLDASPQIDYVVTAGDSPAEILQAYTAMTGRPPAFPEWAEGYWQSKLRYDTQEKVLEVAREHRRRGLPLDVIVIDFFHWTRQGEWRFDPADFPDPAAMVAELRELGVEPMISIWPTVSANAETHDAARQSGYLVEARHGALEGIVFHDRDPAGRNPVRFYDATNPDARAWHWQRVHAGYAAHGFRAFWLDSCEPEMYPMSPANLRYHAGEGRAVTNAYPFLHQQGYAEGMAAAGIEESLLLSRSAWAGSQRFPVVVWSGDVRSTFADLARQVRAGLNMALSGIPWWTTDIGGFKGGDLVDPGFVELVIRWFQYAVFCPVCRMHGMRRDSRTGIGQTPDWRSGADSEVWSFGAKAEAVLAAQLGLRENLRPYLRAQMRHASETGLSVMRPLFIDFPAEAGLQDVDDQFMFGPDMLIAPITEAGQRCRRVVLPSGAEWLCPITGARHPGGAEILLEAPLERIPVLLRAARAETWHGLFAPLTG